MSGGTINEGHLQRKDEDFSLDALYLGFLSNSKQQDR